MWRNPKLLRGPRTANRAHADSGKRLATFSRGDGVEFRADPARIPGIGPTSPSASGSASQASKVVTVKGKGVSVRISEAGELAKVLAQVGSAPRPNRLARPRQGRDASRKGLDDGRFRARGCDRGPLRAWLGLPDRRLNPDRTERYAAGVR